MNALNGMIMVVNREPRDGENLKELIEFMDEPEVRTATPDDWRDTVADSRLSAVFVGADLSDVEVRSLLGDIGSMDPNVPIVMLNEAGRA